MNIFLLIFLVLLTTSVWPVNRIVVKGGSDSQRFGLCISFFAALFSIVAILFTNQPIFLPETFVCGIFMSIGYAVGYCILILKCMETGPTGIAVLFNNLGLLFPTVLGVLLYPETNKLSVYMLIGFVLTILSLILTSVQKKSTTFSKKWTVMIFTAWLFSGLCMSSHFMASQLAPSAPLSLAVWTFSFSFIILLLVVLFTQKGFPKKREILGGAYNGAFQVVNLTLIFQLLKTLPAAFVFPVATAIPIFLVLLLESLWFHEKLGAQKLLGCVIGILGVFLLSFASNL